jgi:SpoIID/LytB domain protein
MRVYASLLLIVVLLCQNPTLAAEQKTLFESEPTIRVLLYRGKGPMTLDFLKPSLRHNRNTHDDKKPQKSLPVSAGALTVQLAGNQLRFKDADGDLKWASSAPQIFKRQSDEPARVLIKNVPYGVGWWWEGREDREYTGQLEIWPGSNGEIEIILELPVEEYLRGVVPSEIGPTAPLEALKAQAVAARSETITALVERQYAGDNYDICADVSCQVFAGKGRRNEATDQAISDTYGLIISYAGKPIPAYYASNSGGFTEDIQNVWPGRDRNIPCWTGVADGVPDAPDNLRDEVTLRKWLSEKPDAFSNAERFDELPEWSKKYFRWEVETSAEELTKLVARKKDIGRVLSIKPGKRGVSGRLIDVTFVGEKGEYTTGPELKIRQMWQPPLRSACFVVDTKGPADRSDTFIMKGGGYGHGVGLCQTGAMGRAVSGQEFTDILNHYYQQAEIIEAY